MKANLLSDMYVYVYILPYSPTAFVVLSELHYDKVKTIAYFVLITIFAP